MTESPPAAAWNGVAARHLMQLEPIGADRYCNPVTRLRSDRYLYGGQVMAHAVGAAALTAPDREIHSLHGYFLRAGDGTRQVEFEVERTRDGRSFSARRVVARQNGEAILHMECSFRVPGQRGLDHQLPMAADIPLPEDLETLQDYAFATRDEGAVAASLAIGENSPIEMKPVNPRWLSAAQQVPRQRLWLRIPSAAGEDDPVVLTQLLTYLSDFWLARVGFTVHDPALRRNRLSITSIDHALWFHHRPSFDDWLLYEADSPIGCHSTSLSRGAIYTRDGRLIASSAQESLIRVREAERSVWPPSA